jgi:hypothetical protein
MVSGDGCGRVRSFPSFGPVHGLYLKRPLSALKPISMIQDAENGDSLAITLEQEGKRLSRAEFQGLGDMAPTPHRKVA